MSGARRVIAVGLVGLLGFGVGCGSGAEPESEPSGLAAPITISRGGGIAGTLYETTVDPDGSGVFDEREAFGPKVEPKSFTVGDAELDRLAELAAETPFEEIGDATTPACADCFVYEITYGDERLRVDSASLERGEPGDPAGPLISALEKVGPDPDAS
ncbi:hypothetical protein HJD18_03060 [Thermoleophilia bacterium SCSIO 60948]|nr:hypothetical protein HJD18_03060 [Thermoleophilia bacterium SCSIO 60948]